MSKLTENVRVRLSANEKAELDKLAATEDRSASAVARRAIRAEVERVKRARRREV